MAPSPYDLSCWWDVKHKHNSNKDADRPAHLRSLISTFVSRDLESTISKLATSEISIFYLVSVPEQVGLNLTFVGDPEDRFSREEAQLTLKAPRKNAS